MTELARAVQDWYKAAMAEQLGRTPMPDVLEAYGALVAENERLKKENAELREMCEERQIDIYHNNPPQDEGDPRPLYRVRFCRPDGTEAWLGDNGPVDDPEKSTPVNLPEANRLAAVRERVYGSKGWKYWVVPVTPKEADDA